MAGETADLTPILGETFIKQMNAPILEIGKDRWSRAAFATELHSTNAIAATKLSAFCKKEGVKSVADLYNKHSLYSLASERQLGVTTAYVALRALEARGYSVLAWCRKSETDAIVTFLTLKHREQLAEQRTRQAQTKRRRQTRRAIHEKEVDAVLKTLG